MAIQFNCPSCEAMIRVPDTAAGKKGTCPRCGEKLLVPDLATATGGATGGASPPAMTTSAPAKLELPPLDFQAGRPGPVSARAKAEPQASTGLPAFSGLPSLEESLPEATPGLGLPPLAGAAPVNIATQLKQKTRTKKKQVQGAWIIPVVCGLGFIAFLAWYMWNSQPKLEGELAAHGVRDFEVKPGIIPGSMSGLSAQDRDEVLRHLRAEPAHWTSSASKMTLIGSDEGVAVTVAPGTASHFVAVQPLKNPTFLAYVTQHSAELDKPRIASITTNAPKLFAAWQQQFTKHKPIADQKTHRDLVALPSLMTGVGYHLEAIVNGNIHPCVYEDADGQVYFLLPNATKSFRLQGRHVAGGSYLPANFHVKVTGTVAGPATLKKNKSKTKEEREQENEGMNPDLYKQNLEDQKQERRGKKGMSEGDALKAGLGDMLTGDKPNQPTFKSKSMSKKSDMMMDGDEDMMNDEMPAKSKPKKGAAKKALPKGEMLDESEEMLEPNKPKPKVPQK